MSKWVLGFLPIVLLGGLLVVFFCIRAAGCLLSSFSSRGGINHTANCPSRAGNMVINVINGGPEPVTVAQVMVDDAFWQFVTDPEEKVIPRLGQMEIHVPYPWVEGDSPRSSHPDLHGSDL